MDAPEHDYGRALSVDAEAIGRPGSRRFRLLVRSGERSAAVWLEKEQLAGIGSWFEEGGQRLDSERPTTEPDVEPLPVTEPFDLEFRVSQLALGYVEDQGLFAIQAFAGDAGGQGRPFFRCYLSRGQCRVLSRKIAQVVAAGRPICP